MTKKILCVIVLMLMLVCVLASCNDSEPLETDPPQTDPPKTVPTQAELENMYQQASNFEENGKFKSAIELYRELYSYGFTDPDFGHNGLDKALAIREKRYVHQKILSQYYEFTVRNLKGQLKDPGSLVIYSMSIDHNSPQGQLTVVFDYGAKNSFGGMVRDKFSKTYTLTEYEKTEVYETNQNHMDGLGLTKEDAGQYLAGNLHINTESQYNAIVNGTNDR